MLGKEFILITVSHYTYGWMQQGLNSIFTHCPDVNVLVIDNNPSVEDDIVRQKSFEYGTGPWTNRSDVWKRMYCEAERHWLQQQPNVILLRTPKFMQHGMALDIANNWAYDHDISTLVHIDPDCEISGRMWLTNLLSGIRKGQWFTAGFDFPCGILHLVPAAYSVKQSVKTSFHWCSMLPDRSDPQFSQIVDVSKFKSFQKNNMWDVSQQFWYRCAKQNKATCVPVPDFKHFWAGSRRSHISATLLA